MVTGGAGYIGSNVVHQLLKNKYKVVIVDNLSTGHGELINPRAVFYKIDIKNRRSLEIVFKKHKISTVIHVAGFSLVDESRRKPRRYMDNNVTAGIRLLDTMLKNDCKEIIFSSSAAVYGNPQYLPITENHITLPISVYGETKMLFEKKLHEYDNKFGIKFLSLRYFNAGGCSDNNKYGERHKPESHLIPRIFKLARQNRAVTIFGNDYTTKDGTCIRDYVHVIDIAKAHILGINFLDTTRSSNTMNLGAGKGYSVGEVVDLCGKVVGHPLKINIASRRIGDPPVLIASNKKAKQLLRWVPQESIHSIIRSAWKFEKTTYRYGVAAIQHQ